MYFQDLQAEFPEFYNQVENDPTASSSRVGAHVQSNNQYQNAADFQRNYRYMRGILPPRAQSIPVRLETPVREPLFFMPSSIQEPTFTPGAPLLRPIDSMVYNMMPTNYVPLSLQQMLFRQAGMPGFVFDAAPGHTVYVPYVQYNHQPVVPAVVSSSSSSLNRTNGFNTWIVNNNIPHGTQFLTHQSTMNQARNASNNFSSQHIPLNFINTDTTNGAVSEQTPSSSSLNTSQVPDQTHVETGTDSQTLNYQNIWQSSYELVRNAADQLMQERNIQHPLRREYISGQAPSVNGTGNTFEDYYTSSISDIEVGISGVSDNILQQERNANIRNNVNDENRNESEISSQNVDKGEPLYSLPHSSNLTTALVDMMKDLLPASLPELAFILDEHVRLQLLESYDRRNLSGGLNQEDESSAEPAFTCATNTTQGNSVMASTTSDSKVSAIKNLVNVTSGVASCNLVPSLCSSKNTLAPKVPVDLAVTSECHISESSSSSWDTVSSNNTASVGTVSKGFTVRRKGESVSRRRRGDVAGATAGSPSKSMKTTNRLRNSKHKGIDDTGNAVIVNKTVISNSIKNISDCNSVTAGITSHCVTVTYSSLRGAGTSSTKLSPSTTQRNFVSDTSNAIYSRSDTGSVADTRQTGPVAGTSQTSSVAGTSQISPVAGTSKTSPVAGTSQTSPVAGTSQTSPVAGTRKECACKFNRCVSKITSQQHLNNSKCIHPATALSKNLDSIPIPSVINEKNSTQNTVKRIPTTLDGIQAEQATSLLHHPSQYDNLAHRAWRNRILFESQSLTDDEYSNRNSSMSTSGRMITSVMQYLYRLITPVPVYTHPVESCLDVGNVHTNAENVDERRNQRSEVYRLAGLNDLVQVPSDCSFSSTEAHTSLSFSIEPESPVTEQQGPFQRYFHNLVYQFYVETFMWIYASIVTQPRYVNIWTLVQLIGQGLQQSPADVLVSLLAGFLDGSMSSLVSQMDMVDLILQQVELEREVFPELIATLRDLSVLFYLRLDPSTYLERFSEVVSQAARNLIFQQEQPGARASRSTAWNKLV